MPPRGRKRPDRLQEDDEPLPEIDDVLFGQGMPRGNRGGRNSRPGRRALSRKRPLGAGANGPGSDGGEDTSDGDDIARDYAENLAGTTSGGAFGALRGDIITSPEPEPPNAEDEGTFMLVTDTTPTALDQALAATLPNPKPRPAAPPVFATVTGLGGPGSEIGAFPPIDTLIRNASDELMLTDSDSDSDEDLLHDGPMGGASDSSSMDSEDARDDEDEDDGAEEDEDEDDDDEALFRAILERRRSAQRAQSRPVGTFAMESDTEGGDVDMGIEGAAAADGDDDEDASAVVNRTKPTRGGAADKKRKRAKGSGLLPGEKKKLRKEGIRAKRAARAAASGFDLSTVNAELAAMVHSGMDVHAFPPMDKHALKVVQKLATLYGLKSGIQGSGKRRFLLVQNTRRAAVPLGEGASEVRLLLTLQEARQTMGARGGGSLEERKALARLAGVKGISADSNGVKMAKQGKGAPPGRSVGGFTAPLPMRFVAAGTLQDVTEIEISTRNAALEARRAAAGAAQPPPPPPPRGPLVDEEMRPETEGGPSTSTGPAAVIVRAARGAEPVPSPGGRVLEFNRWAATHQVAKEGLANATAALEAFGMMVDVGASAEGAGAAPQSPAVLYDRVSPMGLGGGDAQEGSPFGLGATFGYGGLGLGAARDAAEDLMREPILSTAELFPFVPAISTRTAEAPAVPGASKKARGKKGGGRGDKAAGGGRGGGRSGGGNGGPQAPPPPVLLPILSTTEFGAWERSTNGFGSKMLAKMGFDGRGLGRHRDGIVDPIQVEMRAKKRGLGAE